MAVAVSATVAAASRSIKTRRCRLMALTLIQAQVAASYLGLTLEEYREKRSKKTGEIGRGAVYVLVDPGFTDFILD